MIRRPPRSTLSSSSAASDVYKRQHAQRTPDGTEERHETRGDAPSALFDDVLDREHLGKRRRAEPRSDQAARRADRGHGGVESRRDEEPHEAREDQEGARPGGRPEAEANDDPRRDRRRDRPEEDERRDDHAGRPRGAASR